MVKGCVGASTAATRASARQRIPSPSKPPAAEFVARVRGRGRGRGRRGTRGGGGWGGAPAALPPAAPPPMGGHVRDQPYEFFIRLYKHVCSRLQLSTPFARVMEQDPPHALRLHMRSCRNDNMWADVDFPRPHVMYLRQGWKTFAHAHSLSEGHVLHFKLMESDLVSVKVFGSSVIRLGCCVESSTDDESSSSSDSGAEDNASDEDGSGQEDYDSDSS